MEQAQHTTTTEERHTFTGWLKVLRARKAQQMKQKIQRLQHNIRTHKTDDND